MTDPAPAGFFEGVFDRTLTNLRSAWREIAESARGVLTGTPRPDLPGEDASRLHQQMLSCLGWARAAGSRRGLAPPISAAPICRSTRPGASASCSCSPREFDVDHDEVRRRCQTLIEAAEPAQRTAEERALRDALGAAAHHPAATVQRASRRGQIPRRSPRRADRPRAARSAAERARGRSEAAARQLVRHRLSRAEADHLGIAGGAARKADGLRGGARDPRLDRSEEPARRRPPLLRLLSSAHAGRAADLCRGGAGFGHGRQCSCAARRGGADRRSAGRRRGDLLFDLELPARAGRASALATF